MRSALRRKEGCSGVGARCWGAAKGVALGRGKRILDSLSGVGLELTTLETALTGLGPLKDLELSGWGGLLVWSGPTCPVPPTRGVRATIPTGATLECV